MGGRCALSFSVCAAAQPALDNSAQRPCPPARTTERYSIGPPRVCIWFLASLSRNYSKPYKVVIRLIRRLEKQSPVLFLERGE